MAPKFLQIMLTPAVQQAQDKYFGKHQLVENPAETDEFTNSEAYFIASRDSFYMATTSETGGPTCNTAEAHSASLRFWGRILSASRISGATAS